jgi:hydroxyacylglutathione hydrolase
VRVLTQPQPGHEYTKGNVKFGIKVLQSEPVKKLEAFANENKQTQGKFTIGDEKVSCDELNTTPDSRISR